MEYTWSPQPVFTKAANNEVDYLLAGEGRVYIVKFQSTAPFLTVLAAEALPLPPSPPPAEKPK
jgi:hypothetical protein